MAYTISGSPLASYIRKELELAQTVKRGSRNSQVRRVQEWLYLHGFELIIDGDFGPGTESQVKAFQKKNRLQRSGIVAQKTYDRLVAPMVSALIPTLAHRSSLPSSMLDFARIHLKQHPREVGGQNRGPWVRLYTEGHDGREWAWCAAFVTFVMKQAAETIGVSTPIDGSVSCDSLANQADNAGLLVRESDISRGRADVTDLSVVSVFLRRKTSTDWTHTGFVTQFDSETFLTIEGNTNDDGSREGYEVCRRTQGYGAKDFIVFG